MSAKLYYLLEELKENYSPKLLTEVLEFLDNEFISNDLLVDEKKSKEVLNGQSKEFYNAIASNFVDCLEEFPQNYFLHWETILSYFDFETLSNFFDLSKTISNNSDATDYINGLIELNNGSSEIALYHFNRIDDYISCYFIGLCYYELENYENAIKNYNLFLNTWEDFRNKIFETSQVDFLENNNYIIIKWNVYNNLGYLYNRISEFENAKSNYEKSIEIVTIEENYLANYDSDIEIDDFTIFANNYLWTLEKLGNYKKCIEILDFVISKYPNDLFYKSKRVKFIEKLEKHSFADEIINNLFKVKKPFNINSFQETKYFSPLIVRSDILNFK